MSKPELGLSSLPGLSWQQGHQCKFTSPISQLLWQHHCGIYGLSNAYASSWLCLSDPQQGEETMKTGGKKRGVGERKSES